MAINGLGSYYTNWFNNLYKGSTTGQSSTDLMALMKKANEVRSPEYRKKMIENGGKVVDSEIGTVKSEKNLSDTASKLQRSAAALTSMSIKDIEDRDNLIKKVSEFADDYNSTIDALGKSNSVDALRAGVNMKNTVGAFAGSLRRIGISVGSDNKLTIDSEKMKTVEKESLASVFSSNYSVIGRVYNRAEDISKAAMNKAMTTAFTQYYDRSGNGTSNSYGGLLGSIFNSKF